MPRAGVQPRRDRVLVVPLLRVEVEALHRRAAVDQARDAHAVVEVVGLLGDDVDLRHRMAPADVVGGGHAGDPVAEHDHALDRAVVGERRDPRERRLGRLLGLELHRHRALDPGAARHPRGVGEAEPVERGALVVGDRRQVLHAVADRRPGRRRRRPSGSPTRSAARPPRRPRAASSRAWPRRACPPARTRPPARPTFSARCEAIERLAARSASGLTDGFLRTGSCTAAWAANARSLA